jgi:preprotein translocase SecF subunit
MFTIVQKRHWYFLLSALIIVPGLVAMIYSTVTYGSPVRLGIDFTGGTLLELRFDQPVDVGLVRQIMGQQGFPDATVQSTTDNQSVVIRTKAMEPETKTAVEAALTSGIGALQEQSFTAVGPAVGSEVARAATVAVAVAAVCLLLYIAYSFRKIPGAFRYGTCAIIAMIHDILVIMGLFSIAGIFLGWEADSLFLTAVMTVASFSVQDTIVVYDRLRENTPKHRGEPFEMVANRSLLETIHRTLTIQICTTLVLVALLMFGGVTMKHFVAVLLVGLISGSYSSIFNAVPLLVVWETGKFIGTPKPKTQPSQA